MSTVIIFLVVIVFLVVAHELGHFLVAKAFGIRVDEFGVGYPPRAKKLFTWKKTLFTLNWLPFGGFVKIFGEELDVNGQPPEVGTPGSFVYQKMWKRALVIVAGILANIVLAIVLYSFSFGIGFLGAPSDFPHSSFVGTSETLITGIVEKSPAAAAGFSAGDVLLKISTATDTLTPSDVPEIISFIKSHGEVPVTFTVKHSGEVKDIIATPKINTEGGSPSVGITLDEVALIRLPFFQSIGMGVKYTFSQFGSIIAGIGTLISGLFHAGGSTMAQVSGPVGIAQFAGQAFALGFGSFLSFMALISINLAVINLLPFPALDGGRLVIELFSKNGRSKISPRVVGAINQTGFILLIILMLYVTYKDIVRIFV